MVYAQILIIDDIPRPRSLLAQQLAIQAYEVHTAKSHDEARACLKRAAANGEPYELICLGPMMQASGLGHEVLRSIRNGGNGYEETKVVCASYNENFWNQMKPKYAFEEIPYTFVKGTADPIWNEQALREHLPAFRAKARA